MDIGSPIRIKQESGKLIINPTSKVAASNYGGTVLGEIAFIEFRFNQRNRSITMEEMGGQLGDLLYLGDSAVVGGVIRGDDPDALGAIFPNTVLGASVGRTIRGQGNGTIRAGALASDRAVKLLFAPTDSERGTHILLYKAAPALHAAATIGLYLGKEKGFPFAFWGLPAEDTKRSVYEIALRENMTLSPT